MHKITILHVEGCDGARQAAGVASTIAEARDDVTVEAVLIEDGSVAASLGFRGSPTMLVDGVDIELDPRTPLGSMGWRRYQVPGQGIQTYPSAEQILQAIEQS